MAIDTERRQRLRRLLRLYLRDRPELNRISGDYDFTDDELEGYLELAVMDWNATPPPLPPVTVETHPQEALVLFGAAVMACESDAVREARGPFAFADGGAQTPTHAKPQGYEVAVNRLSAAYERNKQQARIALNIGRGWGGVSSDYAFFASGGV